MTSNRTTPNILEMNGVLDFKLHVPKGSNKLRQFKPQRQELYKVRLLPCTKPYRFEIIYVAVGDVLLRNVKSAVLSRN